MSYLRVISIYLYVADRLYTEYATLSNRHAHLRESR